MRARYWTVLALFAAAVAVAVLLRPRPSPGARGVPEAAVDAMRDGRYLQASQVIRAHLRGAQDTSAETIVLLARAEAGWGDWGAVEKLLTGRPWLDQVQGGIGRELLGRSLLARGDWAGGARELGRYLDVAEGVADRERGVTLVREGQALQRQGRTAAALQAFDQGAEKLPPIRDWIGFLAAGAAADAGDTAEVRRRLAPLSPPLSRDRGWSLRVRAAARARDTAAALALAANAASQLPDASARAAAWRTVGDLGRAMRDAAGARKAYDRAMTLAPGSADGVASARALLALAPITADQQLRAGQALLRADPVRAAAAIRSYLAAAKVPPGRRSALLRSVGNAFFDAGRYADAIANLRAGLRGAAPGVASGTLFTIGRAQYRAGRAADARATMARLVELYGGQPAAASAFFLLGDLEQDAGHTAAAAGYFRRAAAAPGRGGAAGDAYMRLGEMAFTAADYAGAARTYDAYLARFPAGEHTERAVYWAARAYTRLGQQAVAREHLERIRRSGSLSYYGVRAAELLREPIVTGTVGAAMLPRTNRQELTRGTARIDLLHELELDDAADFEARTLQARLANDDAALYDLAEALDARGLTAAGVRIGWDLRRRAGAWNPRLLRIVYPFPYRDAIVAEARGRGLDPYLVAGLIRQESGFNPEARSGPGAIGLMQIMPGTGRTLARGANIAAFEPALLERPDVNVRLGTAFVAELLRQADGNVAEMLAAYNAGPARLARWRRYPEAKDPELFAERIPYEETSDYVRIVQANARIYAALYPGLAGGADAGVAGR